MSSGASDDAADSAQKNKRMRQGTQIILHRATQTRLGFFNVIPGRTEQGLGTSKEKSHMERAKTKLFATLSLSLGDNPMQIRLQATTETEVHSPQRCSDGDRKRERAREGECDLWSLCIAKSCHAPCLTRRQKLMEPHSHTHTCEACPAHTYTCTACMEWHIMSWTASWAWLELGLVLALRLPLAVLDINHAALTAAWQHQIRVKFSAPQF